MFKHQLLSQFPLSKTLSSVAVITSVGFAVTTPLPASAFSLTPTPVDTELSLLIDVSGSISDDDYKLQKGAYANAFKTLSSSFGANGLLGSVAVNLIQWASATSQKESISWTLVDDEASARQFAETISAIIRPPDSDDPSDFFSDNFTAPGSAINFAVPLFSSNDYEGQRWVIDVSGDGKQNAGDTTSEARDAALKAALDAGGVLAINGLPILTSDKPEVNTELEQWYADNVQGGDDSFIISAKGFDDVDQALQQKLRRELTSPVPDVPGPTNILGIALAGVVARLKKRRRSAEAESA